jgi:hypothetical protein
MSEKISAATKYPGMGAILGAGGVAFRVWVPHAERVFVTGTFNDWSETSTPLVSEKNGYWFAEVPEAKTRDEYKPSKNVFNLEPSRHLLAIRYASAMQNFRCRIILKHEELNRTARCDIGHEIV